MFTWAIWHGCTDDDLPADDRPADTETDDDDDGDSGPGTTTPDDAPGGNVLIVLLDDVGTDRIGAYTAGLVPHLHTPTIDALAAVGVRFTHAWGYSGCTPTRAALQTGRHARRTGHGDVTGILLDPNELGPEQLTIAEVAKASPRFAYHTAYVGKWHLSTWSSPSGITAPTVQGWDAWSGTVGNLGIWSGPLPPTAPGYYQWQEVDATGAVTPHTEYATRIQTDRAIASITALSEPWLAMVAFNAAHPPWDAPPDALTSDPGASAGPSPRIELAIVEAADRELGRLLDAIDPGTLARTTIIVAGDNGTPSSAIVPPFDPARSKGTMFDGGVRIPLIVTGPLVEAPGVSDALVHVVDVLPTVAAIVGVDLSTLPSPLDPDRPLALDGVSLLPLLAEPTHPAPRDTLYSERFAPRGGGPFTCDLRTIRDRTHKLVVDALSGAEALYAYTDGALDEGPDLLADGVTADERSIADRLRTTIDALVAGMAFEAPPFGVPPDDTGALACP